MFSPQARGRRRTSVAVALIGFIAAAIIVTAASAQTRALLRAAGAPILSTGPHGEKAYPATKVNLTAAEIQKVKSLHATAAIALHYGGNDWSTAQVSGLKHEFGLLGIKVVGVDYLSVEEFKKAHPELPVYLYAADHGFNCDQRGSYDAAAAKLARERAIRARMRPIAAREAL